jgi:hypothetical protein
MSVRGASPSQGRPSLALNRVRFVANEGVPRAGGALLPLRPSPIPFRSQAPQLRDASPHVKDVAPLRTTPSPSRRNASLRRNDAPAKRSTEGFPFNAAPSSSQVSRAWTMVATENM